MYSGSRGEYSASAVRNPNHRRRSSKPFVVGAGRMRVNSQPPTAHQVVARGDRHLADRCRRWREGRLARSQSALATDSHAGRAEKTAAASPSTATTLVLEEARKRADKRYSGTMRPRQTVRPPRPRGTGHPTRRGPRAAASAIRSPRQPGPIVAMPPSAPSRSARGLSREI